jgi:peptidoglycan hydrolase CwlO-like protein
MNDELIKQSLLQSQSEKTWELGTNSFYRVCERIQSFNEQNSTIYISGAMSGHPEYNAPLFKEVAEHFTKLNFNVFNPHDNFVGQPDVSYEEHFKEDVVELLYCTHIHMLPGWEKSKGAYAEYLLAKRIGLIFVDRTGIAITPPCAPETVVSEETIRELVSKHISSIKNEAYKELSEFEQKSIESLKREIEVLKTDAKDLSQENEQLKQQVQCLTLTKGCTKMDLGDGRETWVTPGAKQLFDEVESSFYERLSTPSSFGFVNIVGKENIVPTKTDKVNYVPLGHTCDVREKVDGLGNGCNVQNIGISTLPSVTSNSTIQSTERNIANYKELVASLSRQIERLQGDLQNAQIELQQVKIKSEVNKQNSGAVEVKEDLVTEVAQRLVLGDRRSTYDHPYNNFLQTAKLWSALGFTYKGIEVAPENVAEAMVLVKMSRESFKHKHDNLVDEVGYVLCHQLVLQEKERRVAQAKKLVGDKLDDAGAFYDYED